MGEGYLHICADASKGQRPKVSDIPQVGATDSWELCDMNAELRSSGRVVHVLNQ